MRIAVMATGAVGGYLGARLAAAGHKVSFIARGANLEAIRKHGLKLESTLGDLHIPDAKATADPGSVGLVDVVLFAVKLWDTEIAANAARPMAGPTTRVITLQNGVDAVERMQPILGVDRVVAGTMHIAAVLAAPGVVRHTSAFARLRCGHVDGKPDAQLARFVDAAKAAGIDIVLSDNIEVDRWKKFVFLVALSGATGATRQPLGPILADADTRKLFIALMRETAAVARAKGVPIDDAFVSESIGFAEKSPPGFKSSLLHDLERGNRLELDWLAGKVVALGRTLGVPTPANQAVYSVLKLHRMGAAPAQVDVAAAPGR
jgi:2-dehydropantoate 2-reductase